MARYFVSYQVMNKKKTAVVGDGIVEINKLIKNNEDINLIKDKLVEKLPTKIRYTFVHILSLNYLGKEREDEKGE